MQPKTYLRSVFARYFSSPGYAERVRNKARRRRLRHRQAPRVYYFHQVDDPYSHLAVQKLPELTKQYTVEFQPYLVSQTGPAYQGSAPHFKQWALLDAQHIAEAYGTHFTPTGKPPAADAVRQANNRLAAHLKQDDFAARAVEVGHAVWRNQPLDTDRTTGGQTAVREGDHLRRKLGHYQGAMFYFEGEWYWGLDRLRLLESRLIAEGFARSPRGPCVPQPKATDTSALDANHILLEYFPSLRSPYTAIGHQRVLDLVARSGVQLQVRPVMPMLMRGIPAPREKQRYIISDAGREGRAHNAPLGKIVDPIGEPVKRAFALFPAADAAGKGMDFVTAYLQAAWVDGVDITTHKGLRQVAANAGLDADQLAGTDNTAAWETVLQENLAAMLDENLWGVPSFRVSGGNLAPFACWGQDRIWRVENDIARRA